MEFSFVLPKIDKVFGIKIKVGIKDILICNEIEKLINFTGLLKTVGS